MILDGGMAIDEAVSDGRDASLLYGYIVMDAVRVSWTL
jgi:hypothetical protein